MITRIETANFGIKIIYSNRFPAIEIYDLYSDFGNRFPFDKEIADKLESAKNNLDEVGKIIFTYYQNKKGERVIDF